MAFYVPIARASQGTTIPPPPPPISFGGTIAGGIRTYAETGNVKSAAKAVVSSVVARVPVVGDLLGDLIGGAFETKSKANWRRTLGRVYRASVLGYVPDVAGAADIIRQIVAAWQRDGDATGARFWDRVVAYFAIPTEKGGTKEGFNAGAPSGSKRAESQPGFSSGLSAFLAAVGV